MARIILLRHCLTKRPAEALQAETGTNPVACQGDGGYQAARPTG